MNTMPKKEHHEAAKLSLDTRIKPFFFFFPPEISFFHNRHLQCREKKVTSPNPLLSALVEALKHFLTSL